MNKLLSRIVMGVGVAIISFAVVDWRVSSSGTAEPVNVDLADVEAGNSPTNMHWKIGPHRAAYDLAVFSYSNLRNPSARKSAS